MRTQSKFFSAIVGLLSLVGLASAETFSADGGSITAVQSGDNVTITVAGMSAATTLVHFQNQGIKNVPMTNGVGVLEKVSENGARFQVKDASGKWLLITPSGNPYKMVGVAQECKKSKKGCALEAAASKKT